MFGTDEFAKLANRMAPRLAVDFRGIPQCNDQWVGGLRKLDPAAEFDRYPAELTPIGCRLIVVLESPHVAEYDRGNPVRVASEWEAIGPANGATGRKIRRHLERLSDAPLSPLSTSHACEVILMNAVQFPCTRFEKDRLSRDRLFRECWSAGAGDEFRGRLRKLIDSDTVVMNACTRGVSEEETPLNALVKDAIRDLLAPTPHWQIAHPFSWSVRTRPAELVD